MIHPPFQMPNAQGPYRYMTQEEKNKARYWFRMFKNSYTMKNFLKERKRKRDKEKSPLHPSYKEIETEIKEKDQKPPLSKEKKKVDSRVWMTTKWVSETSAKSISTSLTASRR